MAIQLDVPTPDVLVDRIGRDVLTEGLLEVLQ